MYEILKDFAGPGATVAAAVTAAIITRLFGLRQSKIAQQQADTALDQLRYNLFEKRYAIYDSAKELIKLLIGEGMKQDFTAFKVIPHYVILEEARFFFSDDIYGWLRTLRDECQKFLEARADSFVEGGTEPKEFWGQAGRLVSLLNEMPSRFQTELVVRHNHRIPYRHAISYDAACARGSALR